MKSSSESTARSDLPLLSSGAYVRFWFCTSERATSVSESLESKSQESLSASESESASYSSSEPSFSFAFAAT